MVDFGGSDAGQNIGPFLPGRTRLLSTSFPFSDEPCERSILASVPLQNTATLRIDHYLVRGSTGEMPGFRTLESPTRPKQMGPSGRCRQ